jgi:hypothetical protein
MDGSQSRIMECLNALHEWHTNTSTSKTVVSQRPLPTQPGIDSIDTNAFFDGPQIAQKFAVEASNHLSPQQIFLLQQFLRSPMRGKSRMQEPFSQKLEHKLDEFNRKEAEMSLKSIP